MAAVCKNGMWGYIDKQGKECIPCIYDYVDEGLGGEPLRNFHEGLVAVCENDKWGFVDKKVNRLFLVNMVWLRISQKDWLLQKWG